VHAAAILVRVGVIAEMADLRIVAENRVVVRRAGLLEGPDRLALDAGANDMADQPSWD
jgi:hypothetical protein